MFTFDNTFIFGTATSSYQIEGARYEGGRSDCIWDKFCEMPGKILNNDTGDVACDHYHKFQEDIDLNEKTRCGSYRFQLPGQEFIRSKVGIIQKVWPFINL